MKRKFKDHLDQVEDFLQVTNYKAEYEGDCEHEILQTPDGKILYLVKSYSQKHIKLMYSAFLYYSEVLTARFYTSFAYDSIMAETLLVTMADGEVKVASHWEKTFVPYLEIGLPRISKSMLVVEAQGQEREVLGYIGTLVVARFIGDFDCIGKTVNAGCSARRYTQNKKIKYKNIKIDPGTGCSFNSYNNIKGIEGVYIYLLQKILIKYVNKDEVEFFTYIPLEMLDQKNPLELDGNFRRVNMLLEYYSSNFDSRDLLIDKLPYIEIIKSQELYNQLALAVERIVEATDEELYELIYSQMPKAINGVDLAKIKLDIWNELKLRQKKLHQLYKKEVEYIKLYREYGDIRSFEELKNLAEEKVRALDVIIDRLISIDSSIYIEAAISMKLFERVKLYNNGNTVEGSLLSIMSMKTFIEFVEEENFELVKIILKYDYKILSQINDVVTLSKNQGSTALLRTKKHSNAKIIKLLLDDGANPRKQFLSGEAIDITDQLPEWIQAIILEREKEQGFSYSEVEIMPDDESEEGVVFYSEDEKDTEEKPDLTHYLQGIIDFVGHKYIKEIPAFFNLVTYDEDYSLGSNILKYIDYCIKKLDQTLLYHSEDATDSFLTMEYINMIESIFLSLEDARMSVFSISKNLLPIPGDDGGGGSGGNGGAGTSFGADHNAGDSATFASIPLVLMPPNYTDSEY